MKRIKRIFVLFFSALLLTACVEGGVPALRITADDVWGVIEYVLDAYWGEMVAEEMPTAVSDTISLPSIQQPLTEQIITHVGYAVSYNATTRLPNWIAYELTHEEACGTIPRGDDFARDPLVKGKQAHNDDYRRSGYDKGHMAPAGDMKWCEEAMDESFYFTNICPQNPNLNRGDWKDLEEKCRDLVAIYDHLYIVCGPILWGDEYETIGANRVVVPDAFYKVLLTDIAGEYQAVGFIFPNRVGSHELSHYACTIDRVEEVAQIDFFASLPDSLENQIESTCQLSYWLL